MSPVRRRRRTAKKKPIVTKLLTAAERRKLGYRNECDICHVKIGTRRAGKKVEIWSFAIKGKPGKIYNRCKRHLGRPCK
jgi:hypothetical protein